MGFRSRDNENGVPAVPRSVRHTLSLCRSLLSERGEVSGGHLASEALAAYQSLDPPGQTLFFEGLASEFSPSPQSVAEAAEAYRADPTAATLVRLQKVAESPRQELFRRLNLAPGGTRVLVEMRERVLADPDHAAQWASIDADLAHLFRSWFNRGFLELRRIDWSTPALILEKLIEYEAVHEIQGWEDLRRRLEADRRCYAFFHPALGDEPIIFVEIALTRGMSARVQPLLAPNVPVLDPATANCAMFYSITNCQEGLRGVPFGNFLIKKVADDLSRELRHIRTFATVSPVPLFREWLDGALGGREKHPLPQPLLDIAARLGEPDWWKQKAVAETAQRYLEPLCADYLLHARQGKEPLDPVARFHLRNGARLERLNWLGDISSAGLQRSAGLMANYVYRLAEVERNHEQYVKQFQVTASRQIELLAKQSALAVNGRPARGAGSPPEIGKR